MSIHPLFSRQVVKIGAAILACAWIFLWPGPINCAFAQARELEKQATWQLADRDQLIQWIQEWAGAAGVDASPTIAELDSILNQQPDGPPGLTWQILGEYFPFVQPVIATLERRPKSSLPWNRILDPASWNDPRLPASAARQIQLAVGCWFARHERYDDALEILAGLSTEQVVAPEQLLFYQGLAQHRLLLFSEANQSLQKLLENEELVAKRFSVVARLMIADMAALENESIDEVARRMEDVRRRQALHRSGKRVIDQEKKVIALLDQMIEELEQQQQQSQSAAASNQGGAANPAQQSNNMGGQGSGDVADRDIAEGGEWGNVPPQKRAAALAEMARDLPPHYREVIEEYFRQLARESGKKQSP